MVPYRLFRVGLIQYKRLIGDNVVIGAGSIVTKGIPSNVLVVGNPCRILREINEHDREYYFKDRKIDHSALK